MSEKSLIRALAKLQAKQQSIATRPSVEGPRDQSRLLRIARSRDYMTNGDQGEQWLRSTYGIGRKEVCMLLEQQNGYCACCTRDLAQLQFCIDHDNTIWEVRGIICFGCNTGLGKIGGAKASTKEAIEGLKLGIAYLERFLGVSPRAQGYEGKK